MTGGGGDPKLHMGSGHWWGLGVPHINKALQKYPHTEQIVLNAKAGVQKWPGLSGVCEL